MKAKTRTNQPVEFENYDLPAGAKILGDVPFEQIKDAQGHNRFVEGEVDLYEDMVTLGFTKDYGKWSLSGTHLMVVLQFSNQTENDIALNQWTLLSQINLPQWIKDKIVSVGNTGVVVLVNGIKYNATNPLSLGDKGVYMEKVDNKIQLINFANSDTYETSDTLRIEFDLLIDNAVPEQEGE